MLKTSSQYVINVVICLSVCRAKAYSIENFILFLCPDCFAHFVCPSSLGWFLTADLIGKIDAYLCEALRWGYNGNVKLLSELFHDADMKLFRSMLRSTHCIHQSLSPLKFIPIKLRTSHCAFVLPYCHYSLYKHSFVLRCIFDGAY